MTQPRIIDDSFMTIKPALSRAFPAKGSFNLPKDINHEIFYARAQSLIKTIII
jgi:hypothetical protein